MTRQSAYNASQKTKGQFVHGLLLPTVI